VLRIKHLKAVEASMENPWKWHLTYNKVVVVENKLLTHRNTFYSWEKNKDRHFKKNLIRAFFFIFFEKIH